MKRDLHSKRNPQITIEDAWYGKPSVIIDVRAPKEYAAGHIPGSINIPLLENNEQETIGILYKKFGQQTAIDKGYEIFDAKLDFFSKQFDQLAKEETIVVYCARGGMRSQVVASFLTYLNFQCQQLAGGYKQFRNWNLNKLEQFRFKHPFILHGKTGVGKTLVLKGLENALDLEGLAEHRGSLFGGIGKKPVSQKTFEANLLVRLEELDNTKPIYIEGESRKIGDLSIPNSIFSQMRAAKALLLEASMETRVRRTIEEYVDQQPEAVPQIRSVITQLTNDLGKNPVKHLLALFDQENYSECFEFILFHYYDRKYSHSMKRLQFIRTFSTEDITSACREITEFCSRETG